LDLFSFIIVGLAFSSKKKKKRKKKEMNQKL